MHLVQLPELIVSLVEVNVLFNVLFMYDEFKKVSERN